MKTNDPAAAPRDALGMASGTPQHNSQKAEENPRFLDVLLRDFPAPLGPENPLPWKVPGTMLSQEEVEGELAELAMGFLSSRSAPPPLAACLAHEAVSQLLQTDLSEFRKLPEQEEEEAPVTREFSLLGPWAYWATLSSQMGARLQGSVRAHLAPLSFPVFLADREVVGSAGLMCSRQGGRAQMWGETSPAWSQRRVDAARYASVHVHAVAAHRPELPTDPTGALQAAFRCTDEIPERQDEKDRIEALGGFVSHMDCWRVNGTLAVSRAIGDVFQKPYVSGEADTASRELTGSEDYLLLACDGFFDVVPHQEVAGLRGSHDNITVMVVFLRDPRDLLEPETDAVPRS
ncbi:hypothetical protein E2I00_005585 [Balaenoptera physalus]|uniref:PPM-type phosphatase domain-containing protein n=1 Tax=Balaenoptera physalus TaxID=9770 RepID=A0A643CDH8_BALPH|nr:hypothetical protein E2I00_005585 [Balaenoptera physalus]